jgi:hypothetical protein
MTNVVSAVVVTAGMLNQMSAVSTRIVTGSLDLALSAAGGLGRLATSSLTKWREYPVVKEQLQGLDIEAKVETVQALLLTVRKNRNKLNLEEDENDVINVCLKRVGETLQQLTTTLEKINTELTVHDSRWFNSWRNPDTEQLIEELKRQVVTLDGRVDMLLKCHQAFALSSSNFNTSSSLSANTASNLLLTQSEYPL